MSTSEMVFHPMQSNEMEFELEIVGSETEDDLINQIAFIYLLTRKFGGKIRIREGASTRGDGKTFGDVIVEFADLDTARQALAHCRNSLDKNGCVHSSYVGALDKADPGLGQAHKLLAEFRKKTSAEQNDPC